MIRVIVLMTLMPEARIRDAIAALAGRCLGCRRARAPRKEPTGDESRAEIPAGLVE
jgi:hypothetical protein